MKDNLILPVLPKKRPDPRRNLTTKVDTVAVSIIVVTMNHLSKVSALLRSLTGNGRPGYSHEIIVIDNCSDDGTVEFIRKNYPAVIIHQNEAVRGFATNNNTGFILSKGDYIFICNPDIVVLPDAIDTLLDYYRRNPSTGILCPQLLNSDLTYQSSVRRFHNLKILLLRALSRGSDVAKFKAIENYLMKNFDKTLVQPVDWALGAAMILRRDIYERLNGFDENFFLYVEDVDLCLRSWRCGYEVIYNPSAVMIHDHRRESLKGVNKNLWYHIQSMAYFILKHNLILRSKIQVQKNVLTLRVT